MKTFNQLTVGDKFYEVYHEQMQYKEIEVSKVDGSSIHFVYSSNSIPRFKTSTGETKEYSRFNDGRKSFYFVNEADAIRFCKARMMKHLFKLIDSAKKSIQQVKDFRKENFELLNHEWTERKIIQLEKELGY